MISDNSEALTFKGQLQILILKYSDTDPSSVNRLLQSLMAIEDPLLRLQSIVQLIKVNKAASLGASASEFIYTNASVGEDLCGKLILYTLLKTPKKS